MFEGEEAKHGIVDFIEKAERSHRSHLLYPATTAAPDTMASHRASLRDLQKGDLDARLGHSIDEDAMLDLGEDRDQPEDSDAATADGGGHW